MSEHVKMKDRVEDVAFSCRQKWSTLRAISSNSEGVDRYNDTVVLNGKGFW